MQSGANCDSTNPKHSHWFSFWPSVFAQAAEIEKVMTSGISSSQKLACKASVGVDLAARSSDCELVQLRQFEAKRHWCVKPSLIRNINSNVKLAWKGVLFLLSCLLLQILKQFFPQPAVEDWKGKQSLQCPDWFWLSPIALDTANQYFIGDRI